MPKKDFKSSVQGADKLFSVNDATSATHDVHATSATSATHDVHATSATHDVHATSATSATHDVHATSATSATHDVHATSATSATQTERINIRIDQTIKKYVSEAAWQQRMSLTEYICALIKADMELNKPKESQHE
ncbi:MAG: hypothetical protein FWC91_09010 [Defluviitaleaceae bacterium]|nr:hypothetical protein [Defluviitaleaceae bacterium]